MKRYTCALTYLEMQKRLAWRGSTSRATQSAYGADEEYAKRMIAKVAAVGVP